MQCSDYLHRRGEHRLSVEALLVRTRMEVLHIHMEAPRGPQSLEEE